LLDRTDRGDSRRRGTDLVRVQQTRAVPKGGRAQPSIYLSELGPRRVVTQLKWFISTIIVAVSGLAIIGVVIYSSMHSGSDRESVFKTLRHDLTSAQKPRAASAPASAKQTSSGNKTDKVVMSSNGQTTRSLIMDRIERKLDGKPFIDTKSYARVVATLATDRPEREVPVPVFNPMDLAGNDAPIARKDQPGAELSSDPRVSVRFTEVPGGFLPNEDSQEISDDDAEKLVAEADAVYVESEASLTGAGPLDPDAEGGEAPLKAEKNTTILYKKSDEESGDDAFDRRSFDAKGGESLDSVIKNAGVDAVQSNLVAEAVAKITKTKKLRANEEVRLALTPSSVEEGSLDVAKISLFYQEKPVVTLARAEEGGYVLNDKPVKPESDADEDTGERASIYLSSFRAARAQGLPDDFITKFLKIHSYDVDFKQRVKNGDSFEMFYDLVQDDSGTEKPGELLFASVNSGGETHGYYRFRTPDGVVDYYDDKGSNAKKFLMRVPIRGARLTSGFGWRVHPLLKTKKLHSGVDWAGPIGTPIMATGNGTIEVAGREGGYGNYVRIRHANGYKTAYGHMLRFAEGITKGAKVRQGQLIGYLGNSGMSTGPHVHYEVLVNNRFTNPLSIKIPRSRQLQGRLLSEFRREKSRVDDLMHRTPVKTRVVAVEK
jgi:murein DD-endopeptidase MepM/ murein hydrolase activator NlpD